VEPGLRHCRADLAGRMLGGRRDVVLSLRFLLSWMQWGVHGAMASRFRSGREAGKNENRFVVTAEHGHARFAPRRSRVDRCESAPPIRRIESRASERALGSLSGLSPGMDFYADVTYRP